MCWLVVCLFLEINQTLNHFLFLILNQNAIKHANQLVLRMAQMVALIVMMDGCLMKENARVNKIYIFKNN